MSDKLLTRLYWPFAVLCVSAIVTVGRITSSEWVQAVVITVAGIASIIATLITFRIVFSAWLDRNEHTTPEQ
jgi:ribose/xylose/arabinose/galactoside ABC-type transport system permease subunit